MKGITICVKIVTSLAEINRIFNDERYEIKSMRIVKGIDNEDVLRIECYFKDC